MHGLLWMFSSKHELWIIIMFFNFILFIYAGLHPGLLAIGALSEYCRFLVINKHFHHRIVNYRKNTMEVKILNCSCEIDVKALRSEFCS